MRDKTAPRPDERLAELARRQHGVVAAWQLIELGFSRDAIARRVAARRLHRVHRGVYAVGHPLLSSHGAWLAAVLACGRGAVLSQRSAAALWGLRPSGSANVDVTVPRTSGVRRSERIVVHRPRRPPRITVHEAIPVTTPMQTLADLADVVPRRQFERAAEAADGLRLLDVGALPERLRKLLRSHDLTTTTRSALEDAFLELCDRHGIPRPAVNRRVEGFEVDFCWPQARLVVETDGHRHHGTRAAFERDRARDARLIALGWRVIRFTHRQVLGMPETVAEIVLSARSRSPSTP